MRQLPYLLAAMLLVTAPFALVSGQVKPSGSPGPAGYSEGPFTKGNWDFQLNRNLAADFQSVSADSQSNGHRNNFNLDLEADYWLCRYFAVGLDFCYDDCDEDDYIADDVRTRWLLGADLVYGIYQSPDFNAYAKFKIGFGENSETEKGYGTSQTTNYNLFTAGIELGAPIPLFSGRAPVYFTPTIGYSYLYSTTNGEREDENRFRIGLALDTYFGCAGLEADRRLTRNWYNPGRSFIDFSTDGSFQFGNTKTTYNGGTGGPLTDNTTGGSLSLGYGYYFIPNLAIGADLHLKTATDNYTGDYKETSGSYSVMPFLQWNLPGDPGWQNAFLKGGVDFGSMKTTTTGTGGSTGSSSSTVKYNSSDFTFGFGYNIPLSNHMAFTPMLNYNYESDINTDTEVKTNYSGIGFEFGIRAYF